MLAFQLKSHQQKEPIPQFYIQSKGDHSGRPLKKAIPNCFSVYTNEPYLYNLVYVLYVGGFFKQFIRGTAIPFITIGDVCGVIRQHSNIINNKKLFDKMDVIDNLKNVTKQKLLLIDQMQQTLCFEALKQK